MNKEEFIDNAIKRGESLTINYIKYDGTMSKRTISDIHYSEEYGNGYIDAFCHTRNERRTFKIERIQKIAGWDNTSVTVKQKTVFKPEVSIKRDEEIRSASSKTEPSNNTSKTSPSYTSTSYTKPIQNNGSSNKKKEGCYIATMVYGDYNHPKVMVLRKYRDEHLSKSLFGRLFIKFYYYISPKLVVLFKNNKFVNKKIQQLLDNLINRLNKYE